MGALTINKTSDMLNTSANNAHILYMCTSYAPQICTVRMHTHYTCTVQYSSSGGSNG